MSSVGFVDSLKNMLFGDPVYDERGQVVKRNFGLMNAGMIVVLVALGIGLFKGFPNMKPKSGKKKMKGGKISDAERVNIAKLVGFSIGAIIVVSIILKIYYLMHPDQ